MDPLISPGLAQAKQFPQHDLERIGLLLHQDEQQFLFGSREPAVTPTADVPFAFPSRHRLIPGIVMLIGFNKRREQGLELFER